MHKNITSSVVVALIWTFHSILTLENGLFYVTTDTVKW